MRRLLPLVLLASACSLEATAESDSVCVTQPLVSQAVPGVPPAAPEVPSFTIPGVQLTLDLGSAVPSQLDRNGVSTDLRAQSIAIRTAEGADLTGITSAAITVARPGDASDVVVFRYDRPPGATGVTELRATPDRSVNLVDYLEDRRILRLRDLTLGGRAPATPWTPAVRTCASAKITVDEWKAAGL
jgi:hypothetical protein